MKREVEIRDGVRAFAGFPVVLVTTKDNIITVGLLHKFSYDPFMLGIGISYRRYSHKLIKLEREFGVNIPTAEHLEQVRLCGSLSGRDIDKFKTTGFTKSPGTATGTSLILECPVSIECQVTLEMELAERTWFIGNVVAVQTEDDYDPSQSLFCSRRAYLQIGEDIGPR